MNYKPDLGKKPVPRAIAFVALLCIGLYAGAQTRPERDPRTIQTALKEIVRGLDERYKATILLDPAIVPAASPSAPDMNLPVEKAITVLAASLKDVKWRRIYPKASALNLAPPAERLAATARLLDTIDRSLIVEERGQKRITSYLMEKAIDFRPSGKEAAAYFSDKSVYLLYSTAAPADGRTDEERFDDLQSQQMQILQRMSPALTPNPMRLWMERLQRQTQGQTPAAIEKLLTPIGQAGTQLWDSTPPEQRQKMIEAAMKVGTTYGASLSDTARSVAVPRRNYLPELKVLAERLAKRYKAQVLVDPAIFLFTPPVTPDKKLTLEAALDTLTPASLNLTWRRVYLQKTPAEKSDLRKLSTKAEMTAVAVRALERTGASDLQLETPSEVSGGPLRTDLLYRTAEPVQEDFEARLKAGNFDEKPVYLLYAIDPNKNEGVPIDRLLTGLLQQQMDTILNMTPDQLARSMEAATQMYQNQEGENKTRVMSLPLMAGMMAVWFPIAAKEAKEGAGRP